MNPITELWKGLGWKIWHFNTFGGWRKQAISNEAVARELRNQITSGMADAYDRGWQAGWQEAIKLTGVTFNLSWPKDE